MKELSIKTLVSAALFANIYSVSSLNYQLVTNHTLKFQQLFATPQTTVDGIAVCLQSSPPSNLPKIPPKQTVRLFPQMYICSCAGPAASCNLEQFLDVRLMNDEDIAGRAADNLAVRGGDFVVVRCPAHPPAVALFSAEQNQARAEVLR